MTMRAPGSMWVAADCGDTNVPAIYDRGGSKLALVFSQEDAVLFAASADLLAAARRALPWLGKMIADGGHLSAVLPRDAESALDMLQNAINLAGGGSK